MKSLAFVSAKAALAALALSTTGATAQAQSPTAYRAVQIDMSAIPAGASQTRAQLQACLSRQIPAAFAGRIQPAARSLPVLVVRPTSVWLAPSATVTVLDDTGGSDSSGMIDTLEGEAIAGGVRVPLTVSANGNLGAFGLSAQGAVVRTDVLCQNFAYWLARRL